MPKRFRRPLAGVPLALPLVLCGCSLVTIEFPESPLSELEVNARVATHRFADEFANRVEEAADAIAEAAPDEAVELESLRFKIGATTQVVAAAFHVSPRDALIDTWAYCGQLRLFLSEGEGSALFGDQQSVAVDVAVALEAQVGEIARAFAPPDLVPRYAEFVSGYVRDVPLENVLDARTSSVPAFYEFLGIDETEAIETVGTLGQVVSNFGSRLSTASTNLPNQAAWRSELALRRSGMDQASLRRSLQQVNARIDRLVLVAEQTPELFDGALLRLEGEVDQVLVALDEQRALALGSLSLERQALVEAVSREREATLEQVKTYADELVTDAWKQLRGILNTVVVGAVALVVVLFGVPFGLGVLVGRVTKRSP